MFYLFFPARRTSGCAKCTRISKLPRGSEENIWILCKPKSVQARLSLQSDQAVPDQCPHHTALPRWDRLSVLSRALSVNHFFPSQYFHWLHVVITSFCTSFHVHRWCFPWGLLHPDHTSCQAWPTVLLVVHLQWTRSPAAGCGSGTLTCLPVWGSEWQACPGGLPTVQDFQPRRREVRQISEACLA